MPSGVIRSIREIIAEEMPEWCWFSDPAPEAINRSTLQFRLGCKNPRVPDGRSQRRLCIDLTKELVERLSAFTDDNAREDALNAIRGEISRYFEHLSAEPRIAEWLLTEDLIPESTETVSRFREPPEMEDRMANRPAGYRC